MSIFILLFSLQGLATSGIFFHLILFSLSQYFFNVTKMEREREREKERDEERWI